MNIKEMKEKVIEYNGKFLLKDDEPFFNLVKDLDGEYEAMWYEKIFDTNIYVGVDYHFDYNKLLELFQKYEKKYSTEKTFGESNSYRLYDHEDNGGVYDIDYNGLTDTYIKEILNEDGTLTSSISIDVEGGKYKGWSCEQSVFNVLLFKYNEDHCNTCNYAKFTTKNKMKEFFNELQECVVSIDETELIERIEMNKKEIDESQKRINKIQWILNSNC